MRQGLKPPLARHCAAANFLFAFNAGKNALSVVIQILDRYLARLLLWADLERHRGRHVGRFRFRKKGKQIPIEVLERIRLDAVRPKLQGEAVVILDDDRSA